MYIFFSFCFRFITITRNHYITSLCYNSSMHNTVKCPHCGEVVEVTEALTKQIEEQVGKDLMEKHQKEIQDVRYKIQEETQKKLQMKFSEEQKEIKEELQES